MTEPQVEVMSLVSHEPTRVRLLQPQGMLGLLSPETTRVQVPQPQYVLGMVGSLSQFEG